MKKSILVMMLLAALPASALDSILSRRIVSTSVHSETLPRDLHFAADQLKVLNSSWYGTLFGNKGCESDLTNTAIDTTVEILASGPQNMELFLDGRIANAFAGSKAHYIPVYYKNGTPIHPHYLVRLLDWVLLHVSIHKNGDQKSLTVSLVQGKGDDLHLVPIFEALGH